MTGWKSAAASFPAVKLYHCWRREACSGRWLSWGVGGSETLVVPLSAFVVEFDFASRQQRPIALEEVQHSCRQGLGCWVDLNVSDAAEAQGALLALGVNPRVIEEVLSNPVEGRHDVYEDCLHVTVSAQSFQGGKLIEMPVDLIVGTGWLCTLHRGEVEFLKQVRRSYPQDFAQYAQTLSFLLYEFWDHLTEQYRRTLRALEDEVQQVRVKVVSELDDQVLSAVSEVTKHVLVFRHSLLAAREVLHELAVRRSPFVSESTQPFLDNLAGTLERLAHDMTVAREVLAESFNIYLGLVAHRTNRLINRLTIISVIFLPLTFLCGVYGMNFKNIPELEWEYGYLAFWTVAAAITGGLVLLIRAKRLF
jgi:magnesium transporter